MKKLALIAFTLFVTMVSAQEQKQIPQVVVFGEGKIKVKPDQVKINFGIDNTGKDVQEVKKKNDENVEKVLKFIKKFGIPQSDFQTTNVSLNRNYDYDKKKYNFLASQSISITLNDISKYDSLMMGLVDNGITNITNVSFESTEIEKYKSEARKLAMIDAKRKATDFVLPLNQKIGKALLITDNSSSFVPPAPPFYKSAEIAYSSDMPAQPREVIAIGEIEVSTNVSVSFMLE